MLLLFDIDGTLLRGATEAHRKALYAALEAVHGIDPNAVRATLSPAGRTDSEIARAILLTAGVDAKRIDDREPDVREECCRVYAEIATSDLSHTVVPGMAELLGWLSAHEDVLLSLVTGNYETIARVKLKRAGIGRYFPTGQGAFGSDDADRAALPPIARRRAGPVGHPYPRERTIVVGDTPRDIACAHADDLRCFAVATGPFQPSELTQADAVAATTGELRELLRGALSPGA
jgi:phosphoglycolate phosphatase-like HAD superfamily hydrolase